MPAQADDFFTALENTKPFLKMGLEGFAGGGKTFTMGRVAIGLHRRIASKKPIIIFDTETAAKFLAPQLEEAGITVRLRPSRSVADLVETMRRMRDGAGDILLIDSLTHLWENFVESYKAKVNRTRLEFQDWSIIKPAWKATFSDPYVMDPYHCLFTGRAAYEYDNERDQHGKRQLVKSGVKMRVEGETAYEPDLLVLMDRVEQVLDSAEKTIYRVGTILKDRSDIIDGKSFKNPSYDDFSPVVERCLAGAVKRPALVEGDTAALFKTEEDRQAFFRARDILTEEIEGALTKAWPGQTAEAKQKRAEAAEAAFGTTSWTKIKGLGLKPLEDGKKKLAAFIESAKKGAAA